MTTQNFQIGQEIVRSKGDYVVGRVGVIIALDTEKKRAQVKWNEDPKSWVLFTAIELTSKPYVIEKVKNKYGGTNPKYKSL
jgi:hypothetical protein